MEDQKYYVVLKDNATFSYEVADKIRNMELSTYEERFPLESKAIEVYCCGTKEECVMFKKKLDEQMNILFEVKSAIALISL